MGGYGLFRKGRSEAVQEVLEHIGNFLTKMPEELMRENALLDPTSPQWETDPGC